jgi:hypothetical protein
MADEPVPPRTDAKPPRPGTSRAYFLWRLERDGHAELLAAVAAGRLSARAAAVAAGISKRPPTSQRDVSPGAANRRHRTEWELSRIQPADAAAFTPKEAAALSITAPPKAVAAMELILGPPSNQRSAFGSREQLRRSWEEHREELLQRARPGRRPQAWWEFETLFSYPGFERERSYLWRADLLSAQERAALEAEWRAEFDRSYGAEFFVAMDNGILEGADARRAHLAWADVPMELRQQWRGERRRDKRLKTAV